ncbi:M13 family metallopeptidase [Phenylobacterium sp.]|uniref:M13 family metallopeptidase n=1 Tax=Phenylobacterium sp. TaxID=1871053 RepID=UPI0035ADBF85
MNHWKRWAFGAIAPLVLTACATTGAPAAAPEAPPMPPAATAEKPKPQYGAFGFDAAGMDASVKPGDDFFEYADGGWVKATEIPADRSTFNTFAVLRELASKRTAEIIDEAAKSDAPAGSNARKIGDYYSSFMDEAKIEALGAAPLKPELARIAAIGDRKALARELGAGLRADVDPLNATNLHTDRLFGLWVAEALDDTSRYRPYLLQGGLGMPDREYYLSDNERLTAVRADYEAHIGRVLALAGFDDVAARAKRVLALETAMAKVHWTTVDSSDIDRNKTVWKQADFAAKAPGLDWNAYFTAAGLADQPEFGVWQPSAIAGLAKLVGDQPLQTWRDYLAFHAVEQGAPYLSKAFVDENFAFNGKTLSGVPEQRARWKRGVDATSDALGEAVGQLYVARYFPPQAKAEAQAMVKNILAAFDARIERLDWMTPATKAKAHEKLANFQVGVGYPDKWRDYSGLEVVTGDAFGNHQRAELFEYRRNLAKLGRPVDRGEWYMTPQTVNALNAPLQNSIIFPAAILEPPFFDPAADPAVNYGAIGGVIGHEITHGFDDLGAMFDAQGNLRNWWTPEDLAYFKKASAALISQYDAYQPLPDLKLNGAQTLSENIADLGGLSTALDAYHLSLGGQPAPVIDGFTGDQRVFLGWAQNYRSKARDAALRRQVLTDVHSPGEYRADTVRNLDAWYSAFDVQPDQKLYLPPEGRVRIW